MSSANVLKQERSLQTNFIYSAFRSVPIPVLLFLICAVVPIRFEIGTLQMTLLRCFLVVMFLPSLFHFPRTSIKLSDVFFAVFSLWVFFALFRTQTPSWAENSGAHLLEFFGSYLIARAFVRTSLQLSGCFLIILCLVCVSIPFALIEAFTGDPVIIRLLHALPGISSVEILDIPPRLGLERVQAFFAHPIHYGLFATFAFSAMVIGFEKQMPVFWRMLSASILFLAVFVSLSSGALLSVLLQSILVGWFLTFRLVRGNWLIFTALVGLMYLAVSIISDRTALQVFLSYATFSSHTAFWRSEIFEWGLYNIFNSPWVGIGLNDWVRPHYMHSGSIDNFWLVVAMRYGVPGLIVLVIGLGVLIYDVVKAKSRSVHAFPQLKTAWLIMAVGTIFTLATVHIWTSIFGLVWFLLGCGYVFEEERALIKKHRLSAHRLPFQRIAL